MPFLGAQARASGSWQCKHAGLFVRADNAWFVLQWLPCPRRASQCLGTYNTQPGHSALQELGAVGATVQRYPSVLLWPLVMLALVIGLGVFGVVWADQVAVKDLRKQAEQQAKATVSSFSLLVQKVEKGC